MAQVTRAARTIRFLALLVQLALPGLAGVADARLELDALSEPTHVESESHDCHFHGHPADCAICQFLRGGMVAQSAPVPVVVDLPARPRFTADIHILRPGQRSLAFARGPPTLS